MSTLLVVSLVVNVVVLIPITLGLARDARWATEAYGTRTPARQILLAIYLAILALSGVLLMWGNAEVALGLLLAQIVYKVLTPISVGTLRHPVVLSNLAIAALHAVTVLQLQAG